MSDMNIWQATELADGGAVVEQIRARLAAKPKSDASYAKLMVEIAQLALAEAARVTDDGAPLQRAIDNASEALG